jgi:hypothetical protein
MVQAKGGGKYVRARKGVEGAKHKAKLTEKVEVEVVAGVAGAYVEAGGGGGRARRAGLKSRCW